MAEVITTVGASSSLFFIFQAFVHPGDEVIVFEPFFAFYAPMAKMTGAKVVALPLKSQGKHPGSSRDLAIDPKELSDAITPQTKTILINTPYNPMGKVFQRDELEMIAELCPTLPGMWERTIAIGSAGKTFNSTGWKLGWSVAPAHLIRHMGTVCTNSCYTIPTLLQEAVAVALEREIPLIGTADNFFRKMRQKFCSKRDEMAQVLSAVGFKPIVPESGYFMVADTAPLGIYVNSHGVALIPVSDFYTPEHSHLSGKMVRFCFGKTDDVLQEAFALLQLWANEGKGNNM